MKNLTLNDATQAAILPHLAGTEALLARAASAVSGKERGAEVVAMPDLCFPNNVERMLGGFYTGAVYSWECDEPFVPVDSTVNSCGVSMFRLRDEIRTQEEFARRIQETIDVVRERSSYSWNFASGNHFVTYGTVSDSTVIPNGPHLLLHSSHSEFKRQHNGLYPVEGNWFHHAIERIEEPATHRVIRFVRGKVAEQFIGTAQMLRGQNEFRHYFFAKTIAKELLDAQVLNEQHYGMPTQNSVAIGCQWTQSPLQPLLTAPNEPVYIVQPQAGTQNDVQMGDAQLRLFPHGLGKQALVPPTIAYTQEGMRINGRTYGPEDSLKGNPDFRLRDCSLPPEATGNLPPIITAVLEKCPAKIVATFHQIYSYHAGAQMAA